MEEALFRQRLFFAVCKKNVPLLWISVLWGQTKE